MLCTQKRVSFLYSKSGAEFVYCPTILIVKCYSSTSTSWQRSSLQRVSRSDLDELILRAFYQRVLVPVSDQDPGPPGLGFFPDPVPGRDHQFRQDFGPGFADGTEHYTGNFIDFYCKLTVHFSKKLEFIGDFHPKIKSGGGCRNCIYVSTW